MTAVKKRAPARLPTLPITCQVPYHVGLELQAKADALVISRHKLFLLAFQAGFPIIHEHQITKEGGVE